MKINGKLVLVQESKGFIVVVGWSEEVSFLSG